MDSVQLIAPESQTITKDTNVLVLLPKFELYGRPNHQLVTANKKAELSLR